jgi:hypothetical protein
LLLAQTVRNQTLAAFAPIESISVNCELAPPALQRAEPHPQQSGHFSSPSIDNHGVIRDLQGLAAFGRKASSSPSSPQ